MSGLSELRTVFLGPPGAGKGTQAKALVERVSALHVSSGDMLREHRRAGTELGRKAEGYMDAGKLVPDDLIIAMVMDRIQQPDAGKSWILDGFPRTLPQARSLDECLQAAGSGLTHVAYFDVPREVLVRRLTGRRTCSSCGAIWHVEFKPTAVAGQCDLCGGELTQRPDDRAEVVEERLEQFRASTEPLLDYYRSRGVLVEINANQAPDDVLAELVERLGGSSKPS